MMAQSRYQGCTTGNSSTVTPSATPRPPTGCSRPRSTASSSQLTVTAMISTPIARVSDSTAVVWSPRPSRMPTCPVPSASSVGGDIQLRTTLAVPRVNSQPNPSPLAQPMSAITASASEPLSAPADRNALSVPPQRLARAIAVNPSASSPGNFTCEDSAISTVPATSIPAGSQAAHSARVCGTRGGRGTSGRSLPMPRRASSVPVSIRPSISASLWIPATRCISSSGLAAPSHSAVTSATPHRRASLGTAHTIRPTPISTTTRWQSTAATMFCPVRAEMPSPIHRNSGP